jgi:hypothetical protein
MCKESSACLTCTAAVTAVTFHKQTAMLSLQELLLALLLLLLLLLVVVLLLLLCQWMPRERRCSAI